jgi:hypothetical protein
MAIPSDDANGSAIARIPQANMRIPQAIDHPVISCIGPVIVFAFIISLWCQSWFFRR